MTQASRDDARISVIIPTYNRADDLPRAVASVLDQTHPAFEILIVDDGSQDETEEVVAQLSGPIRYLRQENEGVSVARNRAMEASKGSLIAFLDTDDRWNRRKLEIQVEAMARNPDAGWSATNMVVVDQTGEHVEGAPGLERAVPVFGDVGMIPSEWFASRLTPSTLEDHGARLFLGDAFGLLLNGNFVFPSTLMIQRSLMEKVGLFDPDFRRAEDNEYALRLAAASDTVLVDLPLTEYRQGASDQLTNPAHTAELTRNALRSLDRALSLRDRLSQYEQSSYHAGRRRVLLRQAYECITNLDPVGARRTLGQLEGGDQRLGLEGSAILATSLLPVPVLRLMGALKRRL
jgi:GT2 family glycosyltransferase